MDWLDGGEDLLTAQLGLYELISPNSKLVNEYPHSLILSEPPVRCNPAISKQ